MSTTDTPDISVIIVNWNTAELLNKCLQSLYATAGALQLDILVVDNASQDNSVQLVKDVYPQVQVIENTDNLGFARANNQGLAMSRAPYVLFLNSDVFVGDSTLRSAYDFLKEHAEVGVVGPMMRGVGGESQMEAFYRRYPSWMQLFLFYLSFDWLFLRVPRLRKRYWSDVPAGGGVVDQVPGAFLFTRREVLDRIGGLDERFFIFFEDVDWCRRCSLAGWQNYYLAELQVTHVGSASFAQWGSLHTMRQFYRSLLLYWEKYFGAANLLLVRCLLTVDSILLILFGIVLLPLDFIRPVLRIREKIHSRWTFITRVLFSKETRVLTTI